MPGTNLYNSNPLQSFIVDGSLKIIADYDTTWQSHGCQIDFYSTRSLLVRLDFRLSECERSEREISKLSKIDLYK